MVVLEWMVLQHLDDRSQLAICALHPRIAAFYFLKADIQGNNDSAL